MVRWGLRGVVSYVDWVSVGGSLVRSLGLGWPADHPSELGERARGGSVVMYVTPSLVSLSYVRDRREYVVYGGEYRGEV